MAKRICAAERCAPLAYAYVARDVQSRTEPDIKPLCMHIDRTLNPKADRHIRPRFMRMYTFQNLDALHDHLGTLYPGMRAPSFRCTEETDGSLILHYYSERPGLEHIVIGIVRVSQCGLLFLDRMVVCKIWNYSRMQLHFILESSSQSRILALPRYWHP